MDVQIEKDGAKVRLSSIGLLVTDFKDSSPALKVNQREINNRAGKVFNGAVHSEKSIQITGKFQVDSAYKLEEKKDEVNGLISNDEPFYVTKMLPAGELYDFELPGQKTEFDLLKVPHDAYKYRYKVIGENEIEYEFLGKSQAGLLMAFTIELKTAELPFGETVPIVNEPVVDVISYKGTANCSQLEWPWTLKLTSSANQSGKFYVTVGKRRFESHSPTPIVPGDIFLLKGFETLKNQSNFNDSTNYEHFILNPSFNGKISVYTDFVGRMEILNKVELYK